MPISKVSFVTDTKGIIKCRFRVGYSEKIFMTTSVTNFGRGGGRRAGTLSHETWRHKSIFFFLNKESRITRNDWKMCPWGKNKPVFFVNDIWRQGTGLCNALCTEWTRARWEGDRKMDSVCHKVHIIIIIIIAILIKTSSFMQILDSTVWMLWIPFVFLF